jgi:hypothetical protein
VAVDLNTLIDPASGWILTEADDISDTNWIAGIGTYDPDRPGGQAAYQRLFLIQVPEPICVFLLNLVLVVTRRRKACTGISMQKIPGVKG